MQENREKFSKKTGLSFNPDQTKKPSTGIVLVTRAAVDALSKVKDAKTRENVSPNTPLQKCTMESKSFHGKRNWHSSASDVGKSLNSSREYSQMTGDINSEEIKKSVSPLELGFNGTQRVSVPSRLLREIKSPLDRGSVTGKSVEGNGII